MSGNPFLEYVGSDFAGEDGLKWFWGHVTTDAAWREHHKEYGYRVKVRIIGKHPAEGGEDGVADKDLPWAIVTMNPVFGSGKDHSGTSMNLRGGELVWGFYADEDQQVPVIVVTNYTGSNLVNYTSYLDNSNSSYEFVQPYSNPNLIWSLVNQPIGGIDPASTNGLHDENNQFNKNDTKQVDVDEQQEVVRRPEKCKDDKSFMSQLSRSLASFIEVAEGLEKFEETYIDPVMDEIRDVQKLVSDTAEIIAGAYAQVIRLARKFLFAKIYDLVEQLMGFLQLDSLLKDIAVKKAVDQINCVLEKIIKALQKVIEDFLIGLIGKIIQAPVCAAEQFLGGLNTKMFNEIESAIGDAMDTLSGVLGPVGSFMGYLEKAMGYAQIGIKLLSCEDQKCEPEPYDWALNFGPTKKTKLDFKKTIDISSKFNAAGIGKSITDGIDKFFGLDEDDIVNAERVAAIIGDCPVNNKVCGPPKIEIFGGGGIGAAANAVINEFGSIVGVNMQSLGVGYTEKPYVSIIDNCDGRGAEGEAIIKDGQVINIIIRRGGGGYQTPPDVTDSEGVNVVGEIEDVEIIRTGRNYREGDLIVSQCGTFKPILDDIGRIVGAKVVSVHKGCKVIPDLSINTETGYGALVRPIMRYNKFDGVIIPDGAMKVIDCVAAY
tara:strand:- start:1399 stop:3369 length:1971 start_codon:yes stop_codon:yes gene_type:complete